MTFVLRFRRHRRTYLALPLALTLLASVGAWVVWPRGGAVDSAGPNCATSDETSSEPTLTPSEPDATPSVDFAAALDPQLADLAAASDGIDFAVEVVDHRTGATYRWRADTPFVTASIVKVEILAELLLELRQEGRSMTATQQQLATKMIENSDNDAANSLWEAVGGADGMAAADEVFGMTGTTPGRSSWGSTTTTVADQVTLLDAIAAPDGPLGADNSIVLDLMGSIASDQDWGVSAATRDGETVRLKNGWVTRSSVGGTWEINSIGQITGPSTDLIIAILSAGHATQDCGVAFVEKLAALARAALDPDIAVDASD